MLPPLRGSATPELHGTPPTWRPPSDSARMLARTPRRAMGQWPTQRAPRTWLMAPGVAPAVSPGPPSPRGRSTMGR
eukprot:12029133-Alexandrium_andersonii.AAC.1